MGDELRRDFLAATTTTACLGTSGRGCSGVVTHCCVAWRQLLGLEQRKAFSSKTRNSFRSFNIQTCKLPCQDMT
jgi:hypothetical protein